MRLELSQVPMSPLSELTSDHPAVSDTGEIMQKTHTAADNRSSAGTVRLMTIVSDLILALELTRQAAVIIIAPACTGAPVIRLTILPADFEPGTLRRKHSESREPLEKVPQWSPALGRQLPFI